MDTVHAEQISGGDTIEKAATIFRSILNGTGTNQQNQVVLANAALAIQTFDMTKSFEDCYDEAEVSLKSKRALNSLTTLIN